MLYDTNCSHNGGYESASMLMLSRVCQDFLFSNLTNLNYPSILSKNTPL